MQKSIPQVVIVKQDRGGGGVKGSTYVLRLGIAHFRSNSKEVPHSLIPKLFTRGALAS